MSASSPAISGQHGIASSLSSSSSATTAATAPLCLPHHLSLFVCRHGERVDQVFGIDWIEQAFRTYKIHGAEERAERDRLEAQAVRKQKREARRQAKLERRRHTIDHSALTHVGSHAPHTSDDAGNDDEITVSSSSDDESPTQPASFSFNGHSSSGSSGGAGHSDLHHASYLRFNLNMPRDLPARLPRRDISHFAEDAPLTECGHWQAGLVGEALLGANIQHVYASPALRCIQTAEEICLALGLIAPARGHHATGAGAAAPAAASHSSHLRSQSMADSGSHGPFSSVLSASPPAFAGIRVEYGLFEWMGWYRSYPHWLSLRELAHAGLHVDQSYSSVTLRPKQGETQREWYVRSSDTMQKILAKHFSAAAMHANKSQASSRRSSLDMATLNLASGSPPKHPAGGAATPLQPMLYTHGNILFVGHAGSLDTLSYGLLHSNLPGNSEVAASLRVAPSQEELSMGKRMRLFSNYCGTGRIQYIKHFSGGGTHTPVSHDHPQPAVGKPGWDSRRNSLSLVCDTDGHSSAAQQHGHWQIADDSHYDMTNTSNDPFSFQLSYASYQKTIAHLLGPAAPTGVVHSPQSAHSLAAIQKQLRDAQADGSIGGSSGADAFVLRSVDAEDDGGDGDPDGLHTPPRSPPAVRANSAPVPPRAPKEPRYAPALLALPAERPLDLNFRKLFGALLDSCNALANFLGQLSAKQMEKLSQRIERDTDNDNAAAGMRARGSPRHRPTLSHGSQASAAAVMLLSGGSAGLANVGVNLDSSVSPSSSPRGGASSSSLSAAPAVSVLESWILLEIGKNSAGILALLPREWSQLLGYKFDRIPLHLYKLMIALRRFVVPLRKWQRLPKEQKNIVSWICLMHHIARSDCLEHGHRRADGSSANAHLPLRCDFLCSLSSCMTAVDILARQGFAKKSSGAIGPVSASPRSPSSPSLPCAHASSSSRELQEWMRRAEKMRKELKEARDGRDAPVAAAAASSSAAVSSLPSSSRPSTPPPSSLRAPPRTDGFPHSYDLLELVSGLDPIFGTDTGCADILKGVLLHSFVTSLVVGTQEQAAAAGGAATGYGSASGSGSSRVQSSGGLDRGGSAGVLNTREMDRARFAAVLLSNSANSDATTSLTTSSSLPVGAEATAQAKEAAREARRSPTPLEETAPSAAVSSSSSPPSRPHRPFLVPSSLLSILPRCMSPSLFECVYLFSMAHLSADLLTNPQAQTQVLLELQDRVADLKASWDAHKEQQAAAAAANNATTNAAAATMVDTGL